jgi:hypothetical protein
MFRLSKAIQAIPENSGVDRRGGKRVDRLIDHLPIPKEGELLDGVFSDQQ